MQLHEYPGAIAFIRQQRKTKQVREAFAIMMDKEFGKGEWDHLPIESWEIEQLNCFKVRGKGFTEYVCGAFPSLIQSGDYRDFYIYTGTKGNTYSFWVNGTIELATNLKD